MLISWPELSRQEASSARWKLLLGENGMGKSTILEAISIALIGERAFDSLELDKNKLLRRMPSEQGVVGEVETVNEAVIELTLNSGIVRRVSLTKRQEDTGSPKDYKVDVAFNETNIMQSGERGSDSVAGRDATEPFGGILSSYGAFRMLPRRRRNERIEDKAIAGKLVVDKLPVTDNGDSVDVEVEDFPEDHLNVHHLFNLHKSLTDAENWLLNLEGKETMAAGQSAFDSAATVVRDLLIFPNEHLLDSNERKILRREGDYLGKLEIRDNSSSPGEKVVQVRMPEGWFALGDLSDGYKSVIVLACDIMRAAGVHRYQMTDTPGIVLVDEIGGNLHPRWKMRIVGKLRKALPKMQFIVTTHEPLCLRGVRPGESAVLVNTSEEPYGKEVSLLTEFTDPANLSIDQILTSPIFGLSSVIDSNTEDAFNLYYAELRKAIREAQLKLVEGESIDTTKIVNELREREEFQGVKQAFSGRSWREYKSLQYLDAFLIELEEERENEKSTRANNSEVQDQDGRKLPDHVKDVLREIWNSAKPKVDG